MRSLHRVAFAALFAAGCQTYSPAPVDLPAHAREFAARLPDPERLREFAAAAAAGRAGAPPRIDLDDGIDLDEARCVALLLHPGLRTMRAKADVAAATAGFAGLWSDPQLSASFANVLESAWAHRWIVGGSLAQALPITGLPGLERALADARHAHALLEARAAEADVLNHLEGAWIRASAAALEVDLLTNLQQRLAGLEEVAAQLAANGVLMQMEARTFTLARIRCEADLVARRGALRAADLERRELLGLPPDAAVRFVPTLTVPERVPAAERRERLFASPKVELAQRDHDAAERRLELAIRRQWPELLLQPGWQEEDAQPRAVLGFSLTLPLWNANRREIAEARAARDTAAAALRQAWEEAAHALARAEAARATAAAQRQVLETGLVPAAERQVADVKRLAELGQVDALLTLDALTRAYEAQLAVVAATAAEATAAVELGSLYWPSSIFAPEPRP